MRAPTSPGVEKKNGGSSFTPPIGTVVTDVPDQHRHHGDEQLEREQLDAGHDAPCAVVIRVGG